MLTSLVAGSAPIIIDKTHAELSSMATGSTLVPGQDYRITDFRTRHLIPNTAEYNTGSTEPLIVTAATTTLLRVQAISETYPQDIIYYELVDSSTAGGDRGRIFFRHDTGINISAWEDWRAVVFRRWESLTDIGVFNVYIDNGEAYVDLYMFNNSPTADTCQDISIGRNGQQAHQLSNNIFGSGCKRVVLLGNSWGNTHGNNFIDNKIGFGSRGNIWGDNCDSNTTLSYFNNNVIGNAVRYNTFLSDVLGMIINDQVTESHFGHECNSLEIPTMSKHLIVNRSNDDIPGLIIGDELQQYKKLGVEESTFEATVDISGATSMDLSSYLWAGIVKLDSANGTESVNTITNSPYPFNFELKPMEGLTLTLTGTAYAAVNADGQLLLGAATRVLDGVKRDSIKLRKETITNGNGTFTVVREVTVSISL